MFYRQNKTFWYQFCNLKHLLKAENSEDIFASSCEQNSVTCHVTQSETELLLELDSASGHCTASQDSDMTIRNLAYFDSHTVL